MNKFATRKSLYGMVTAGALSLLLVGPALAETTSTTVSVEGSPKNFATAPTASNFAGYEIDGQDHTQAADFNAFEVEDYSGTAAGWAVTMVATQFTEYAGSAYVAQGSTIPVGSLTLTDLAVAVDSGTDTPAGANLPLVVSAPSALDNEGGLAVKVLGAAAGSGMGLFDVTSGELNLTDIPAETQAGDYRSDMTITLTSPIA
jgi:hypothetical protein